METPNGAKRQEAHRTPRGKRATWSGNQPLSKTAMNTKTAVKRNASQQYQHSLHRV
ncbi:hypothetical protein QUF49_11450 [Fictibacillus sp. b24]|uniref:hypothetical protein n=1 Tax=Fictibacillus sp. b24 TaxID=3055863 RepID=UPI0025A0F33E|nr:hypothetical protein [Fictibacillus sp. b24]MDM5316611.1 hypothetical protein [Fictibacillus sp. b24]